MISFCHLMKLKKFQAGVICEHIKAWEKVATDGCILGCIGSIFTMTKKDDSLIQSDRKFE